MKRLSQVGPISSLGSPALLMKTPLSRSGTTETTLENENRRAGCCLESPRVRENPKLTQEQLSFRAGLSRPYISQLERDLKSPTVDTLFRICDALDVSAADIVRRVDAARKRKPDR